MTDSMVRQYLASDAAREHYDKYGIGGPRISVGGGVAYRSPLGSFVDPRDARITKLEAEVANFEQLVQGYDRLIEVMLSDLVDLNQRYKAMKIERNMLAKRIQELLSPPPAGEPDPVFAAVEAHQKQGVR